MIYDILPGIDDHDILPGIDDHDILPGIDDHSRFELSCLGFLVLLLPKL